MEQNLQLTEKCKRSKQPNLGDRISELPDEILHIIVSRLTLKEAIGTSVLSRRWKDMWQYTNGSFKFYLQVTMKSQRENNINWVSKILKVHKGSTIKAFNIVFLYEPSHNSDIDDWIKFALQKKVQKLKMCCFPKGFLIFERGTKVDKLYPFPFPLFAVVEQKSIICLKSLSLRFVNVTGQVLEYFLSNCPALETLIILYSEILEYATVIVPCPKLKHINISYCQNLQYLDIHSTPMLKSLAYTGPQTTRLSFRSAPDLTHLSFEGSYCKILVERFSQLHIPLSQIEKLKLCLTEDTIPQVHGFPELKNLKQLELQFETYEDQSLLYPCISIMEACPNLYEFSMQFNWLGYPEERAVQQLEVRVTHKSLRVVELLNFCGKATDVELATYIISTAPFLKKIMVDTRRRSSSGIVLVEEGSLSAKKCISGLVNQLSPATEIVIL